MSEPAIQRGRGGRMPPFCDVARTPAPEASLLIWMCTHPRTAFRPPRGLDNRTWEDGFRKRRLSWSHWRPWPGYIRYRSFYPSISSSLLHASSIIVYPRLSHICCRVYGQTGVTAIGHAPTAAHTCTLPA